MQYRLGPEDLRKTLRNLAHNKTRSNCRARFDSSDIAQEAFLQVWQQSKSKQLADINYGWLLAAVNGHASKLNRKHTAQKRDVRAEVVPLPEKASISESPLEIAMMKEQIYRMRAAFETLPKDQKDVVKLRFFHGMTFASIAQVVGKPIWNTQRLALAAVESMRRELKESTPLHGLKNQSNEE